MKLGYGTTAEIETFPAERDLVLRIYLNDPDGDSFGFVLKPRRARKLARKLKRAAKKVRR